MKLTDWMEEKGVCVGVTLKEKAGVIDLLAALQQKCGNTENGKQLRREIISREEEYPFAIGAGVAVCYLKSGLIKKPQITAVTVPSGIDLDAPDGEKSRLIFLAAAPVDEGTNPTPRLNVLLMNEDLREQLMESADEKTFIELLRLAEEGDYSASRDDSEEGKLMLAVVDEKNDSATEAASSLQLAAGKMGILLKMERGDAPLFTDEDLRDADGVLLIGKGLCSDRFDGKHVLEIAASDGIYRPEYLLKSVKKAPIFHKKIKFLPHKKQLSDWYYRSNAPLLPLILLAGGLLTLAGEILLLFLPLREMGEALCWIGERSFLLLVPRVAGMLGFRYARWSGLAAGLIGGAVLEAACGGVWAALLGGVLTVGIVRLSERAVGRLPAKWRWMEWGAPSVGVAAVSVLAVILGIGAERLQKGTVALIASSRPYMKGLLLGMTSAMDPGGPLDRASLAAADTPGWIAVRTAAELALTFGLTAFCILNRKRMDKIHAANGWAALPAGLCGAVKGYLVFFAGDPFRITFSAACGGGAAGLLAVALCALGDRRGLFGVVFSSRPLPLILASLCGAVLCCALLWVVCEPEKESHEV